VIDPNDLGHWEGDVFVFVPPLVLGGRTIAALDTSEMHIEGDIGRDDVVHAIVNAVAVSEGDGPVQVIGKRGAVDE